MLGTFRLPNLGCGAQETLPQCARERLTLACGHGLESVELSGIEAHGHLSLPLASVGTLAGLVG